MRPASVSSSPAARRGGQVLTSSLDPPYIPVPRRARLPRPRPGGPRHQLHPGRRRRRRAGRDLERRAGRRALFWANTQLPWYRAVRRRGGGAGHVRACHLGPADRGRGEHRQPPRHPGIRAESMTVWVNALYESQASRSSRTPAPPPTRRSSRSTPGRGRGVLIIGTIGPEGARGPGRHHPGPERRHGPVPGRAGLVHGQLALRHTATQTSVEQGSVDQEVLDDMKWTTYPQVSEDLRSQRRRWADQPRRRRLERAPGPRL